ncbi:acyl-CoA thioesterase [Cardiobacteriaceae bacterium TAE3-ERU3]|nr:acyl-CoA thioesterase [Cardiobacteriaceae bacterium TAE3-ERU3]
MQVVWHGHYVKYLEEARCAWLEDLGYTYLDMRDDGYVWPIVQLQVKYLSSARFGEQVLVRVYLREYESSLKLDYEIINEAGACLTRASTMQAAIRLADQETQFQTPKVWQEKIHAYLENQNA